MQRRFSRASYFGRWIPVGLTVLGAVIAFSAEPTLRITSPEEGAVVQPGEMVKLKVEAVGTVKDVVVMAEDPIGISQLVSAPPYEFTIRITTRINLRAYAFTAVGVAGSGSPIFSQSVSLNIEKAERPVKMRIHPPSLDLSVGELGSLIVSATYPDGSTYDVTQSRNTRYVSQSSTVATVLPDGRITAIGVGSTKIVINGNYIVPVVVSKASE